MNTNPKNKKADDVYETSPANTALHAMPARGSSVTLKLETRMSLDFDPLVPPAEAARLLSTHRSTIWRWVRDGLLCQPIRITARKVGWRRSTLEKFLTDRTGGV